MRVNGNHRHHSSREATPDKGVASPTPVIVSRLDAAVIERPMLYRSTVISPNPERLLYSTVQHPSVILSGRLAGGMGMGLQEQPVDFSPSRERGGRYALAGLAIAV